ncbi:hypothetical protein WA026_000931 [Henosepilachna vigintioctopunctata]|uniref:Uncharacterized protein n=1 Tax=Henosepilachna vigintioctopunctata TaxID=420089 RepID=A0AAW1UZA2_9CUCU
MEINRIVSCPTRTIQKTQALIFVLTLEVFTSNTSANSGIGHAGKHLYAPHISSDNVFNSKFHRLENSVGPITKHMKSVGVVADFLSTFISGPRFHQIADPCPELDFNIKPFECVEMR